ncbi:MAG: 2,3-bisphosphoglycerate-independent phosphoglycerate mutase, partial [Clostridia bacterium]|nr:2,3-bisphosphoglycerate-independent phosphoglycerate mutase [Clostridia bacterium]
KIYSSDAWKKAAQNGKNGALHFIGLLSDGNVHSNISHLFSMIERAKQEGVKEVRVHALLDGRDVPATSALTYIDALENKLSELNGDGFHACIASGGGRMKITMDRYKADWSMVERGWNTHVHGQGRQFTSAKEAIETYRSEIPGVIDQDLPAFVIAADGEPVGAMHDGDAVILYNFRGDRAIEISMAFDDDDFPYFDRGRRPAVSYAGMLEYDGDLKIPKNYLVAPPEIKHTLSEYLVNAGVNQYAISETQKYGHVTYFWNGNRSGKFSDELETFVEIPSDKVSFDERPWMKCAEITDELIKVIKEGKYDFLRCNFPNGDMVGHTGNFDAVVCGMEALDLCLARLKAVCDECGVIMCVTADHGNADVMLEMNKKGKLQVRTAHSLNPVPFIIYDKNAAHVIEPADDYGLSNVAATVTELLGLTPDPVWQRSMLK